MPSVFGCIPSGSRYGNVPNELVHRAGPPLIVVINRAKYVLLHVVVLCFLQVFGSSNHEHIAKKGRRFQLCHQFWAVFLLGQDVVMAQMSLYIELDRHS